MVEEKAFYEGLEQVGKIVVPAHVGELVKQDGFNLAGGHRGKHAEGNEDYRAQVPDDHRNTAQRGFDQPDGSRDAQGRLESRQSALPWGGRVADTPLEKTAGRNGCGQ